MSTKEFDPGILYTHLAKSGQFSADEAKQINESIQLNGMAVIRGFTTKENAARIEKSAKQSCARGYGIGPGLTIEPYQDERVREFRHPYLVSKESVDLITNESLLLILETHLGKEPVIHNALFQISLPATKLGLDFHIDCGSIKSINPRRKFPDLRLRTILYCSDVSSGGFSYILNSSKAAFAAFYPLPYEELMPLEAVPLDPKRRVTINEPAGTMIIFNTHGLHRPEVPQKERVVLNTWFAKADFSGNLPATLFSLALVEPARRHRLHIFAGERGCSLENYTTPPTKPRGKVDKIRARLPFLGKAKKPAVAAYE